MNILENSSSCIGLVFTSQPNLIVDSGTHLSLQQNCHLQIIYAKFNLKFHYPPPYTREVWHYKDSKDDFIRRAINQFNWERAFENKNEDMKILTFNKTVLNILSNLIPHELIVCDNKDPPWFNTKIKLLIRKKIKTYKVLRKSTDNDQQTEKLQFHFCQCSLISNDSKLNSRLHCFTGKRLSTIKFSSNNTLDPNKAHSHDMISIRMLKICRKLFADRWN